MANHAEVWDLADNHDALTKIQKAMFVLNMMRGKPATIGLADRYNRCIREIHDAVGNLSLIAEVPSE